MVGVSISLDGVLDRLGRLYRGRRERLVIKDVHLHNPRVVASPADFPDDLLFEFDITFRLVNNTPKSVGNCQYAIVVEHTTDGPTNDRLTQNFPGELSDYDGLTEPQLSPVIVRTDLDSKIQFRHEDKDNFKSQLSLQDDISMRFKVNADDVKPHNKPIAVEGLISDWIHQCRGMDMRDFADPMEFDDEISELPERLIGEDLNPYN